MDPQAALDSADRSLKRNETARAVEFLFNYYQWRARGGFQPPNGDQRAAEMSAKALDQLDAD